MMTFKEAADHFRIPHSDLQAMEKEGLLTEPLDRSSIDNLTFLSQFWGRSYWLKRQLSRMNTKTRHALVRTSDLGKIGSCIFNRYYNAEKGERNPAKQVADELNRYYSIPVTGKLLREIRTIRRKAENVRHYDRRRNALTF
jgi:hypothetical protein